jgi:hypothetical protein
MHKTKDKAAGHMHIRWNQDIPRLLQVTEKHRAYASKESQARCRPYVHWLIAHWRSNL